MTLIPAPVFLIRIFRGPSSPELVSTYTRGQQEAIGNYGIASVNSCNARWQHNPHAYAIVVESIANQEILGGVRLHLSDPAHPLPMESTLQRLHPPSHQRLQARKDQQIAEICGIWKKPRFQEHRLSRFLTRSAIMQAQQLGVKQLFGFAGQHSIGLLEEEGFGYDPYFPVDLNLPYPDERYRSKVCYLQVPQQELVLGQPVKMIRTGV
jgi:hypothetical protein